jgi:ribose transport system substrate-binding protein
MRTVTNKGDRRHPRGRAAAVLVAAPIVPLGMAATTWPAPAAAAAAGSLVSQEPQWRAGATPAPAGTNWTIAVVPKSVGLFYWGTVDAGAQAAGKYFHVHIIWKGTATETDVTGQVNILQDFIDKHISGIAFAASDAHGLVPTANAALKAGIPVVNIDSGLDPQGPPLVASDNVVAAEKAADILAAQIGYKGQVALLPFVPSAATSIERQQGFEQELKKYPHIKLVAVQYDQSDVETALSVTNDILTAHPQLKGIFDANEPGVDGTVAALAERGLPPGTIKVVGFDNATDEVNDLADGYVSALIVQNPFRIGYQGVAEVVALLEHKKVPHDVDTGVIVATKANMNQPAVHERLFPPTIAP